MDIDVRSCLIALMNSVDKGEEVQKSDKFADIISGSSLGLPASPATSLTCVVQTTTLRRRKGSREPPLRPTLGRVLAVAAAAGASVGSVKRCRGMSREIVFIVMGSPTALDGAFWKSFRPSTFLQGPALHLSSPWKF